MTREPIRELARLRRRIRVARFFESAVRALCAITALVGTAVILARVFGFEVILDARWSWLLVLPIAHGAFCAWRTDWSDARLAVQIDRRLGLGGLLISAAECDADAWTEQLTERVRSQGAKIAEFAPRRWILASAAAALFAGLVVWLPASWTRTEGGHDPRIDADLARLESQIELALEAGNLDETAAEELRDRTGELRAMLQRGDRVDWLDSDRLVESFEHQQSLQLDRLAAMQSSLNALAESLERVDESGDGAQQRGSRDLASAAQHAAALGMEDELPAELQRMLEQLTAAADRERNEQTPESDEGGDTGETPGDGKATDGLPMDGLGLDADAMRRLADGLQAAAAERLGKMQQLGKLDPQRLRDLGELLRDAKECSGEGEGGDKPGAQGRAGAGRGGITRGPGAADLALDNLSDIDTSALDVERLPPGIAAPRDWSIVGLRRTQPKVDPLRDTGAGAELGTDDASGEVSWRRRLAPRHRETVRRFFDNRRAEVPR